MRKLPPKRKEWTGGSDFFEKSDSEERVRPWGVISNSI